MSTPSLLLQAQQAGPKSQPSGDSPLSFASSNTFREELMLKNLKPYKTEGSYSYDESNQNYPI